jgi:enoyl-CoA hydratase/3-hydroxyacyl-CoA dehydrogenase
MNVTRAAVVGAGTMGGEIAFCVASAGIPVVLKDVDQKFIDLGIEKASSLLDRQVEKGRLDAAGKDAVLGLIEPALDYGAFGDIDFVIEAVPERMAIKQAVFAELDAATPGHAILATNTSALSIDEIGAATTRPDKVVGFHFFYPASFSKLVEVIEGENTSPETSIVAFNFAQKIKKSPITCGDAPGFVVNRVLTASLGEMFRVADEHDLSPAQLDAAVVAAKAAPAGPAALTDTLGLDTVLHVMEHLNEELGEVFYVPPRLKELVAEGHLGAKTGKGFYEPAGSPPEDVTAPDDAVAGELVLRSGLRALVESILIVEEAVGNAREVDLGMMMGAGIIPGPLARADSLGLDNALAALEHAEGQWGEGFAPPVLLRRLVAQGRTGKAAGQGFFAYPLVELPEDGGVALEKRGHVAIAWMNVKPVNPVGEKLLRGMQAAHAEAEADPEIRSMVIASANTAIFSAGADLKAFGSVDQEGGVGSVIDQTNAAMGVLSTGRVTTIAAVNGMALGGGGELAMSANVRLAGESASFGWPEINLGILPGFGGTQRLPRLIGRAAAFEIIATGDQISAWRALELGLVSEVLPDHELFDAALRLAERLAEQPQLALQRIKELLEDSTLADGIAHERDAFVEAFDSPDGKEGVTAFLQKRTPRFNQ